MKKKSRDSFLYSYFCENLLLLSTDVAPHGCSYIRSKPENSTWRQHETDFTDLIHLKPRVGTVSGEFVLHNPILNSNPNTYNSTYANITNFES